jgi:hypothetical protein
VKLLTKTGLVIDGKCKNGKHVYLYTAPTNSIDPEPPDGMPCQCGKERYCRKNLAPSQPNVYPM